MSGTAALTRYIRRSRVCCWLTWSVFLQSCQFFVLLIEHLLIEDTVWIIRALLAE